MAQWVAAFVGERAQENYEKTRTNGEFWVSSNRTPIKKVTPGDKLLLYVAGEGFVAEAVASSGAFPNDGDANWVGKSPVQGISILGLRPFAFPVRYKFPSKGPHPVLGFHRYALTSGFTILSEEGLEEVLEKEVEHRPVEAPVATQNPKPVKAESSPETEKISKPEAHPSQESGGETHQDKPRQKRKAGQHAVNEGRKGVVLWTVAETLSQAVGWKDAQTKARDKALLAKNTWLRGGRAEVRVGKELESLCEHGFYVFHDVQLPEVGNIDHVALGPHGFFGIETKSHKGRVSGKGRDLLLNSRKPDKDFVSQTWRGCYRLKEVMNTEVTPLLCFTDAFVEGRVFVRGVKVLPLDWLKDEILKSEKRHEFRSVSQAVGVLGRTTGCYPSAVPRVGAQD